MAREETSAEVSAKAAKLVNINAQDIDAAANDPAKLRQLVLDIRSVAASALSQDETK